MLGKFFGSEFGKGFIKGTAKGFEKGFADDIERTKDKIFTNNIGDVPAHLDPDSPPSTAPSNPRKAETLSPPQWPKPSPDRRHPRDQQGHGLNKPRH